MNTRNTRHAGRPMRLAVMAAAVWLTALGGAQAQESAIKTSQQKLAMLPGKVCNVSIVDGDLYCYASGVLLTAHRNGEQLMGFWADTFYVKLVEGANYVVRQPGTGDIYLTSRDKHDRSVLYCIRNDHRSRPKARKVKIGKLGVEHPVFAADGSIMIFSARNDKDGFGGFDLWYARNVDGKWSAPRNLGSRINTPNDELPPSVYGDCLLFASSGHTGTARSLNLFATRLLAPVHDDTTGLTQIGRNSVQMLPSPLNDAATDDFDMAVDSLGEYGFWVSRRMMSENDSQLYSFHGGLDGVMLWGRITDWRKQAMEGVKVQVSQNNAVVCTTTTGPDGSYQVYLPGGQYYDIAYQKDGYFVEFEAVNTTKKPGSLLITEERRDAVLNGLVHNQTIPYDDLFGPGADLELSELGRDKLAPLIRYLHDNPHSHIRLSLVCDLTDDAGFNLMLTSQRLQTLETYFYESVPQSVEMDFSNGCAGRDGCATASGRVRLSAVLSDKQH